MKHPRICFVIRALRLREMEANVKRKEEEVKGKSEALKQKESGKQSNKDKEIKDAQKQKKLLKI